MSSIFSNQLSEPVNQIQTLRQAESTPVDNTAANVINAITGLAKVGSDAYTVNQNKKVISSASDFAAKQMAAVDQNPNYSYADAMAKIAANTRGLLVSNPQLTSEIQGSVRAVTGANVTEEHAKQQAHAERAAQVSTDTTQATFFQKAASEGILYKRPDGTVDKERTEKYGQDAFARDHALDMMKAQTVNKENRSDVVRRDFEPFYNDFVTDKTTLLGNVVQSMDVKDGKYSLEQQRALSQSIDEATESSSQQIRAQVLKAGGSYADAGEFEARFRKHAETTKANYTGDYGAANTQAANAQWVANRNKEQAAELLPVAVILGSAGVSVGAGDLKMLSKNSDYKGITNATTQLNALNNTLINGESFSTVPVAEKGYVVRTTYASLVDNLKRANNTTPEVLNTIGNGVKVMSQASTTPSSAADQVNGANFFNREDFKQALPQLAKNPATAPAITSAAQTRLIYVDALIKDKFKTISGLKYDPKTNTTGDSYVNQLIQNIDNLYSYSGNQSGQSLQDYKSELFNLPVEGQP